MKTDNYPGVTFLTKLRFGGCWRIALILLTFLPPPALYADCVPKPPGLVSWWRGEGNALDFAGTNNGTIFGGVTFSPGEVGEAFNFDGTSGFVEIPNSANLNPTNEITVEAWINPVSFVGAGNNPIVDKGGWPSYQYHLGITGLDWGDSQGEFQFSIGHSNPAGTTNAYRPGTWYYVVGTYDGSTVKLYVNGLLTNSVAYTQPMQDNGGDLFIAKFADYPGGGDFTPGIIDEISIYNRALTPEEISAIYEAGSDGKCTAAPSIPSLFNPHFLSFSQFAVGANSGSNTVLDVLSSNDLTNWNLLTTVTNITGADTLILPVTNAAQSFYRLRSH